MTVIINSPPHPVGTGWENWLNAALNYYAQNLPKMKAIVESFEESGILLTEAKVSLQTTGLANCHDKEICLVSVVFIYVLSVVLFVRSATD